MKALKNEKILFAGLTGQIGFPLALHLARENEVWGIARFRDEGKRKQLEQAGVTTRAMDLAKPDYRDVPDDFSYLIHFAVYQEGGLDFDEALRVNAEGTGLLMAHCRRAKAALVMSSCAVYATAAGPEPPCQGDGPSERATVGALPDLRHIEDGGGGRGESDRAATESSHHHRPDECVLRDVRRLAALAVRVDAGWACRCRSSRTGLPSAVPIHEDDINHHVGGLLAAASVPATIVNWGGDEAVDVRTLLHLHGGDHRPEDSVPGGPGRPSGSQNSRG